MQIQKFTLTESHIKLLRRFNVGWQDFETGAPEIDPKRPYGNSYVTGDVHEILTGESVGCTDSPREELMEAEEERYAALHKETEIALQIVLSTGAFEPGDYEADAYSSIWRRAGGWEMRVESGGKSPNAAISGAPTETSTEGEK